VVVQVGSAPSEVVARVVATREFLLAQVEQLHCSLQVAAEDHLQDIHQAVFLVVAARWAPATQVQANLATGRCRVLVALQLLVVQQRQRLTQGNSLEVVPAQLYQVQSF
jgi:hypothetical protein